MLFAGTETAVANATCVPVASGNVKLNEAAEPVTLLTIMFVRIVVVAEGTVYNTVVFVAVNVVLASSFDIVAIFFSYYFELWYMLYLDYHASMIFIMSDPVDPPPPDARFVETPAPPCVISK
jgi:hypothetical protein